MAKLFGADMQGARLGLADMSRAMIWRTIPPAADSTALADLTSLRIKAPSEEEMGHTESAVAALDIEPAQGPPRQPDGAPERCRAQRQLGRLRPRVRLGPASPRRATRRWQRATARASPSSWRGSSAGRASADGARGERHCAARPRGRASRATSPRSTTASRPPTAQRPRRYPPACHARACRRRRSGARAIGSPRAATGRINGVLALAAGFHLYWNIKEHKPRPGSRAKAWTSNSGRARWRRPAANVAAENQRMAARRNGHRSGRTKRRPRWRVRSTK